MSQNNTFLEDTLFVRDGCGRYQLATQEQILAAARRVVDMRVQRGAWLRSPQEVREYLQAQLAGYEHEVFALLMLDCRHRLIAFTELFRGTIDGAAVYPREVVKTVLAHNAHAVILAHNHPSSSTDPSQSDQLLTDRLKKALALIDVRVIDHVIVGGLQTLSFAEQGLL